jgi:prepilin-type processing-associated H-X9-DG protein
MTPKSQSSGFVLRELAALLFALPVFVLLIFPLAATRRPTAAIRCMTNLRQLSGAWQMYADDNSGRLVHNLHGGDAITGAGANNLRFAPWASGWLTWGTEPDNTNLLFIRNEKWARLSPYIRSEDNIHKCPSDIYLSNAQRAKTWKERVRSYAMNGTVGHANLSGNPGPWSPVYAAVLKITDLIHPEPAKTSVFLEEHPTSINDPFFFPPLASSWIDVPGNYHSGGTSVSFADGHVEIHGWLGALRSLPVAPGSFISPRAREGDPDIHWMSYHSQRTSSASF